MKQVIIILTLILSATSCSTNAENQKEGEPKTVKSNGLIGVAAGTLPNANGKHGEVLVSIKNDLWEGEIEEIFNEKFKDTAVGPYIRLEYTFDFQQIDPKDVNSIRKKNRNFMTIILDTDKEYHQTEVLVRKNYKAKDQLYVIIRDSDKSRLTNFLRNELKTYITLFDLEETDRLVSQYKSHYHASFNRVAKEKFGIDISIPNSAEFVSNQDTILYAIDKSVEESTRDNPKTGAKGGTYWAHRGVLIWSTPYTGSESMSPEKILTDRDSTLKKVVKGAIKDSYMATEYAVGYQPTYEIIDVNGHQAVKIEGLWGHSGNPAALGGGPFIQYSILHPTKNEIINISAHVFAPRFSKREYIRQIRAMLMTTVVID